MWMLTMIIRINIERSLQIDKIQRKLLFLAKFVTSTALTHIVSPKMEKNYRIKKTTKDQQQTLYF